MEEPATHSEYSNQRFALSAAVVVLICLALGIFFCSIQDLYYSHYQPFFDSVGYYDQLHAVMMTGKGEGFGASLQLASESGTVFMPYFVGTLVYQFVEPSRNLGVWIQVFQLMVLMVSVLYYFQKVKKSPSAFAIVLLAPLGLTTCFYLDFGGLSDFRMDLSLYLTYSISCTWYLVAIHTRRRLHFFAFGLAMAVTCLFRATAPVYLIVGLGPLILYELIRHSQRRQILTGIAIASLTAIAGSLWFFILRLKSCTITTLSGTVTRTPNCRFRSLHRTLSLPSATLATTY